MDGERRAAIKARCEAATPGPWAAIVRDVEGTLADEDGFLGFDVAGPPEAMRGQFACGTDAVFMAAARQDVPDLLTALEEQEARNQELSRRLALAWSTNNAMEAERQGKLSAMLDGLYTDIARLCEERKQLREVLGEFIATEPRDGEIGYCVYCSAADEGIAHDADCPFVLARGVLGDAAPAGARKEDER